MHSENVGLFFARIVLKVKEFCLDESMATVHIDVFSAETGISRFLENKSWM